MLNLIPANLRFHDLRHTVTSVLLSEGQSVRAVSQRLGHSNSALTLRIYAHCMPSDDPATRNHAKQGVRMTEESLAIIRLQLADESPSEQKRQRPQPLWLRPFASTGR